MSSYGKNKFHLKHSSTLLLFNYHKTQLRSITKFFKKWPADLHSELLFPYQVVAMSTEQKNFHANFNILSCFVIWHKIFTPMWTRLREKKLGGYDLNILDILNFPLNNKHILRFNVNKIRQFESYKVPKLWRTFIVFSKFYNYKFVFK